MRSSAMNWVFHLGSCVRGSCTRWGRLTVAALLSFFCMAGWAAPFAYIPNYSSNNVSVIDIATNAVVATIGVGNGPLGVAVNASATRAYVLNNVGNSISVIDTSTNLVIATIPVSTSPSGIAVNAAGTRLYVGYGEVRPVSVIDTATNTVVGTITAGDFQYGIAFNLNPAVTLPL